MTAESTQSRALSSEFVRRTAFVLTVAGLAYLAWQLSTVFLLAFAAVIVAVLLHSLADPINRHTPLNAGLSLAAAGLIIVGLLSAAGWLFGSTVSSQVEGLAERMPQSLDEARQQIARLPFGPYLAGQMEDLGGLASQFQGMAGRLGGYVVGIIGAGANILLVIFAGVFFAAQPARMRDGLLILFPKGPRGKAGEAMNASGRALRLWLLGTLADMVVVGVLTGIGTAIIGLPSPVALGLFAGLAAFVPIVGPIVSVLPGVLLALDQGAEMVLWTIFVYFAVQQIESNLFYPFIQKRAVDLPPVLTLFGVLGFGALFGALGVVLATPLLVVGMVLIKMLYVRNTLGEEVTLPGENAG